jgi:hypothetical protein
LTGRQGTDLRYTPAVVRGLVLVALIAACGDPEPERRDYEFGDEAGRSCVIQCVGDDCQMDCVVESVQECDGAFPRPCFSLGPMPGGGQETLGLCDGCCEEDPSGLFAPVDCAYLVCADSSECPPLGGSFRCEQSRCVRPVSE